MDDGEIATDSKFCGTSAYHKLAIATGICDWFQSGFLSPSRC